MSVEKAVIINTETQEEVRVLFNPEEYTLNLGNEFAEVAVPGLRHRPSSSFGAKGRAWTWSSSSTPTRRGSTRDA